MAEKSDKQNPEDSSQEILLQLAEQEEALSEEIERKEARLRLARNVRIVWSQRTFLVRLAVLGFVLALVLAFLIPARYTSNARLMPPDNQSTSSLAMAAAALGGGRAGGLSEMAGDILGLKSTSDVFLGILTSRTAQDRIVEQFNLRKVYGAKDMFTARKTLAENTSAVVDRKSQMITISVTDHSPQRAAAMAQAYVNELDRLVASLSTSAARRERIFLEDRLKAVSQDLESAEKDFSEFSSKNSTVDIKEQGKAMVGAAANLQGRLIAVQSELEGLRQVYSDSNVRVRAAKARIAELQQQLDKMAGKGEDASASGDNQNTSLYPSLRKLPLLGVRYADLYRRTKVQEAVYEALTQEYELAKVQEAKEIPSVKVLDTPDIPERKTFPPRLLISALGAVTGFIGGVVFLLGSKSWKEKDQQDISKILASEIWTDLKEKRILNSVNGHTPSSEGTDASPEGKKHGILYYLGLSNGSGTLNGTATREQESAEESEKPRS